MQSHSSFIKTAATRSFALHQVMGANEALTYYRPSNVQLIPAQTED